MRFDARRFAFLIIAALAVLALVPVAMADVPQPWQTGFQAAASPVMEKIISLHNLVLVIITVVAIFVAVLLLYVMVRFSRKANPVASRTSRHTMLEVIWTIAPVLILVVIAIPSFRLVYFEDRTHEADMTIKVVGHQWYWEYDYGDAAKVNFTSRMVADEDIKPGQHRLLEVDNQLVVPAGKNVRILTTSADVIHSFFIPSLGVQRYAIPGRTIETWFKVNEPGTYYGQCNQICGTNHSFMPIAIKAVTEKDYQAWLVQAKTKFADASPAATAPAAQPVQLAANTH